MNSGLIAKAGTATSDLEHCQRLLAEALAEEHWSKIRDGSCPPGVMLPRHPSGPRGAGWWRASGIGRTAWRADGYCPELACVRLLLRLTVAFGGINVGGSNGLDNWRQRLIDKLEVTTQRIGASFPHAAVDGRYSDESVDWWTNGFWPGMLWLAWRSSQNPRFMDLAGQVEMRLDDALAKFLGLHHDVGFMWMPSSVARFRVTGERDSYRRAMHAATLLAGRFNPVGGFIRSWGADRADARTMGWVIVDSLMNLGILYWASQVTGDPAFDQIARIHAHTVLNGFVRSDGSTHHIVCYDPTTGLINGYEGGQGYAPDSTWSRGNAWALYGLTLSYAYTGDPEFLGGAERVAQYFLSHLPPDKVPYWDFRLPGFEGAAKDSSAAACAASGLLELARYAPVAAERRFYYEAGRAMVEHLLTDYVSMNPDEDGLLQHGTANFPSKRHVDRPLIYGDYFLLEALTKLSGEDGLFVLSDLTAIQPQADV